MSDSPVKGRDGDQRPPPEPAARRSSKSDLEAAEVRRKIIGTSDLIEGVWQQVRQFAATDIPVLIQGETGTGKELFAWAVHELSDRRRGHLISIDCTTLPEDLFESELFGHRKGSFTGASSDHEGRVAAAQDGSLFLDELAVLSLSCQTKLLRLTENRSFTPLGARVSDDRVLNARFISATNVDLADAIDRGLFREDLFFRLSGVTIDLPPLRRRGDDILQLSGHFLRFYALKYGKVDLEFSESALDALQSHSWPGNVRELQQVIAVAAVSAIGPIRVRHLKPALRKVRSPARGTVRLTIECPCDLDSPMDLNRIKEQAGREAERHIIQYLCRKREWPHQKDLARFLSIDPKTLRARLRELNS